MASHRIIKQDIEIAKRNWEKWKSVFEYKGLAAHNPLLAKRSTFSDFLKEYSVNRTIRRGTSDELRIKLGSRSFDMQGMLNDTSGKVLDARESSFRAQFWTCGGKRGFLSAISKISSFLAPHAFIAWDRYGRKGLNVALERSPSYKFENYAEYIGDMNLVLSGRIGECVRSACADRYPTQYASKCDRFHRRVLDVYLMRLGGRAF
jgi:hypothetical protein